METSPNNDQTDLKKVRIIIAIVGAIVAIATIVLFPSSTPSQHGSAGTWMDDVPWKTLSVLSFLGALVTYIAGELKLAKVGGLFLPLLFLAVICFLLSPPSFRSLIDAGISRADWYFAKEANDLRAGQLCPPAPSIQAPARTLEKGEVRVMTSSDRWSSWHKLRTEHRIEGLEWQWRHEGLCIAVRMRGGHVRVIKRRPGSTTPHIPNGSAYAYASMHASRMELTINVTDTLP